MNKSIPQAALNLAIELAGGITMMAKELGLSGHAVIHQWRLTRTPAEQCPRIESLTGVPCEQLRPDVEWGVLRGKINEAAKKAA